jgi:Ni/Co efflux regulator RcnB
MKRLIIGASLLALVTGTALVADHGRNRQHNRQHERGEWHDQNGHWDNGRHRGWERNRGNNHRWARGERMGYGDWRDAQRVDYREYRLRRPPQGYEWRRSRDRFVLVRVSNGYIFSVVIYGGR